MDNPNGNTRNIVLPDANALSTDAAVGIDRRSSATTEQSERDGERPQDARERRFTDDAMGAAPVLLPTTFLVSDEPVTHVVRATGG